MADNVQLNPGVGGATMRTLETADGQVSVGALAYATTVSPGANVVQLVDSSHGLPVEVVGSVSLEIGAEVAIAAGSSVAVAGDATVVQSDPASLKATATLAPGASLIGKTAAGVDGSTVYSGTTALVPKFAAVNAATLGDNEIVAAVVGKRIQVLRWGFAAGGDVIAKWRSGTTDVTGPRPLTRYASAGGAYCPIGLFQTAAGEALNLNLDAAVAVGGDVTYVEVPE